MDLDNGQNVIPKKLPNYEHLTRIQYNKDYAQLTSFVESLAYAVTSVVVQIKLTVPLAFLGCLGPLGSFASISLCFLLAIWSIIAFLDFSFFRHVEQ